MSEPERMPYTYPREFYLRCIGRGLRQFEPAERERIIEYWRQHLPSGDMCVVLDAVGEWIE